MKAKVIDNKCGAGETACKVLKICPVDAIGYIEVDEAITDRDVNCNSTPETDCDCGCDCGDDTNVCGGNPYSRIVIDAEKCTGCGICVEKCCGSAIEMVE